MYAVEAVAHLVARRSKTVVPFHVNNLRVGTTLAVAEACEGNEGSSDLNSLNGAVIFLIMILLILSGIVYQARGGMRILPAAI